MKIHLLVLLLTTLLGKVTSQSEDMDQPTGCKIYNLGDPNKESFSSTINFTDVISATIKIPSESWQEFSLGFESSSGEANGILKFSKDSGVVLTLKNWDSSNKGAKEEIKKLPQGISSEKWINISLKRNNGTLTVNIDNTEPIVFPEVDTSQFYFVYAHVKGEQYIAVGFNCHDTFPRSTSAPVLNEESMGDSQNSGGGSTVGVIFLIIILVAAVIGGGIWFKKKKEKENDPLNGFLEIVVCDKDEEKLHFAAGEEYSTLLGKENKCSELHQQRAGTQREKTLGLLSETGRDVGVHSSISTEKLFDSTDNAHKPSESFKWQNNDDPQAEEEKSVGNETCPEGKTEKTAFSGDINLEGLGEIEAQLIPEETSSSIPEKEGKQTSDDTVSDTLVLPNLTSGAMESEYKGMGLKHENANNAITDKEYDKVDNVDRDVGIAKEELVPHIIGSKHGESRSIHPERISEILKESHSDTESKLNDNREEETGGRSDLANLVDSVTEESKSKAPEEVLAGNNDSTGEDIESDTVSVVKDSPDGILDNKEIPNSTGEDSLNSGSEIMDKKLNDSEKLFSNDKSSKKKLNEGENTESNLNVDISQATLKEIESQIVPTEPSSLTHEDDNMKTNEHATAEAEVLQKPPVDIAEKKQNEMKTKQGKALDQSADRVAEDKCIDSDGKVEVAEETIIKEIISQQGENETTHPDRLQKIQEDSKYDVQNNVPIGNSQVEIPKENNCDIKNKGIVDSEKVISNDERSKKKLNEGENTESNLNLDRSQATLKETESQIVPTEPSSLTHEDDNMKTNEHATAEAEVLQKPPVDIAEKRQNEMKTRQGKALDQSADLDSDGEVEVVEETINIVDNSPFDKRNSDKPTEDTGSGESLQKEDTKHDAAAEVLP